MSEDKKIIRELTDEEIEDVNGGMGLTGTQYTPKCPTCGCATKDTRGNFTCGHKLLGQRAAYKL